jgi:hypothetical protein
MKGINKPSRAFAKLHNNKPFVKLFVVGAVKNKSLTPALATLEFN